MSEFGRVFANNYDAVYAAKDTRSEVDLVRSLWRTHADGPVASVLDIGCGTGRHAIPLALAGHRVVGVDRSPAMLDAARAKGSSARFVLGDATSVELGESFDAATLLFTVLGYMKTDAEVSAALRTAMRHLRKRGLLVFDVWSRDAVLQSPPQPREQTHEVPGGRVVRRSSGTVDETTSVCRVDMEIERWAGDVLVERERESHGLRFFAPAELTRFLDDAGADVLQMGAPPTLTSDPAPGEWTIWAVARKR